MKKLDIKTIENIRLLLADKNSRELARLNLSALNNDNFDVLDVFDYDTILMISGSCDAEDYLSGRYRFRDVNFNSIKDSVQSVERGADRSYENVTLDFSNIEYVINSAEDVCAENELSFQTIERSLENLLKLSLLQSPEDVIEMNFTMHNFWKTI